jgi:hypothetical protein
MQPIKIAIEQGESGMAQRRLHRILIPVTPLPRWARLHGTHPA